MFWWHYPHTIFFYHWTVLHSPLNAVCFVFTTKLACFHHYFLCTKLLDSTKKYVESVCLLTPCTRPWTIEGRTFIQEGSTQTCMKIWPTGGSAIIKGYPSLLLQVGTSKWKTGNGATENKSLRADLFGRKPACIWCGASPTCYFFWSCGTSLSVVRSAPSTTSHQQDTCMWTTSTIQYHGRTAVQVSPLPVILLYEFKVPLIAGYKILRLLQPWRSRWRIPRGRCWGFPSGRRSCSSSSSPSAASSLVATIGTGSAPSGLGILPCYKKASIPSCPWEQHQARQLLIARTRNQGKSAACLSSCQGITSRNSSRGPAHMRRVYLQQQRRMKSRYKSNVRFHETCSNL